MAPDRVLVAESRWPAVTWTTSSEEACDVASVDWCSVVVVSLSSYDASDVTAEPDLPVTDGVVTSDVRNRCSRLRR